MAESVDALVSNTSGVTSIPVRPRVWVQVRGSVKHFLFFYAYNSRMLRVLYGNCTLLQEKQKTVGTFRERYELSFNVHLNLVTIHPWVDGNGRTARLLMNYIQFCHNLFPTKIFKEDREEYISALRQSQEEETNQPFLDFMAGQLKKSLSLEIKRFDAMQKKKYTFFSKVSKIHLFLSF